MLIRYPGSKSRFATGLVEMLSLSTRSLVEPFAGTAAVTFEAIKQHRVDRVIINDLDPMLESLWTAVHVLPDALCDLIDGYVPNVEDYREFKSGPTGDTLIDAFRLIVLHQTSFSGLGRRSGPIGGYNQTGKYLIDCRWNTSRIIKGIAEAHLLLDSVDTRIVSTSWENLPDSGWSWYLDPPYVQEGQGLYVFGDVDHVTIADRLKARKDEWVLSYDDDPVIRGLYPSSSFVEHDISTYLNHGKSSQRKREVVITYAGAST